MRLTAALALAAALAGCVDLKSPYPDRRFYALEAARSGPPAAAPAGLLRVRRFQASRDAEGVEFAIRSGENAWEADFYHGFFTPPGSQAAEQTARWLGASGLFSHVVLGGSIAEETHLLEGNLVALHADRRDASKPSAVIELQFALLSLAGDLPALLFQKTYRRQPATADASPEALVRGWNAGLAEILKELESDLSKAPRSPK
jgi:hypothetical protein